MARPKPVKPVDLPMPYLVGYERCWVCSQYKCVLALDYDPMYDAFCVDCLAKMLEALTGFKVVKMINQMVLAREVGLRLWQERKAAT